MKITIVTVAYNAAAVLERTIQSVLAQRGVDLEYLILDGGSTDGTVELLRRYDSQLTNWTSEPDQGIYDAMNKGLHRATGDVIAFLNADDVYAHDQVLAQVMGEFRDPTVGTVYGNLVYVDAQEQITRHWQVRPFSEKLFAQGHAPAHPAFFARRELLLKTGGFRTELTLAADYEIMFRVLHMTGYSARHLPDVLVRMRAGGASNNGWRSVVQGLREMTSAWTINGIQPPLTLWLRIVYRRLGQHR
ncbi:glycosyltransferase family 2 protein [Fibrella aquatilis]|uniref:Glycosyltransferase n=1 Tax=Fibrella aquatilis TaxID=2817059 RepID=A0A939GAE7_9BACT|nr:glycosyltransferase family 2 protein [Fibrella aquatilis]MBO0932733.1 glycosyltransferase [Fibrella aquatilis]